MVRTTPTIADRPYSYLNAVIGSIALAFLAGIRLAPTAHAPRMVTATPSVAPSVGFTPNSCDAT